MKIKYNEVETIYYMINLYCKKNHRQNQMCDECAELYEYAKQRIDKCPRKQSKTFCSSCTIHCYKPEMREKIKNVMRFSGPRMILCNPPLALMHVYNTLKEKKK